MSEDKKNEAQDSQDNSKEDKKEEQVILERKDYVAIMQRLEKLESGDRREIPTAVKEHTARLRKHKGKIVISLGKINRLWNEQEREKVEVVDITTEDDKVHKNVDYLEFLRESETIKSVIKDTRRKEIKSNQGFVAVNEVDSNGNLVDTGEQVRAEVITLDEIVTLELPDGESIKVNSKFLNI